LVDARAAGVDPRTVGRSLARAVDLFRGEFLSGFYLAHNATFEGWQLEEQESLRLGQVSALQRLVEIHGALGSYDQAIELARRWLALDPLEEAVHRQLMLLHSLAGRQSEALRQYEKCRSVLERELGAEPSEETEHLREHIASGKLMPGNTRGPPAHRGPPLFLFARAAEGGEEDVRRQEARLREAVGAARGKVLGMDSPRRGAGGS
jgi:DNA-binding SARP family transcriptional activator